MNFAELAAAAQAILSEVKATAPELDYSDAEVSLRCGEPWSSIANALIWYSSTARPLSRTTRTLCERLARNATGVEAEMIHNALRQIPQSADLAIAAA